jgi:hypothetical protein
MEQQKQAFDNMQKERELQVKSDIERQKLDMKKQEMQNKKEIEKAEHHYKKLAEFHKKRAERAIKDAKEEEVIAVFVQPI